MNLEALADFVTVIRHGGFGKAARLTDRPKPTLSRRVRDLEEELGIRLIERGSSSIRLTDEGLLLYENAKRLLTELDDLIQSIGSESRDPKGHLRISAPVLFAAVYLGRIAAEFAKAHPRVTLEVIAEDHRVDLVDGGYDAAIRINPKPEGDLVGRCFARDELLLVAAPSVPRPIGDDTSEVRAIITGYEPDDAVWTYRDGAATRELAVRVNLRVSSMLMVRDAVLAGAGVARLPRSLAQPALTSGKLELWGIAERATTEIWVLHKSRRLESSRLRAFIRFLEKSFPNGQLPPD